METVAITIEEANEVLSSSPFGPWWGYVVTAVDAGTATLELPARPELYRAGGVLQGGCCMTLADVSFWIALMTLTGSDDPSVSIEMTTSFLGPATGDLRCRATVMSNRRTLSYGTADTRGADGALVAHHTLTYLRPR